MLLIDLPHYDIESARKWAPRVLTEGEEVVLTEKIHGANGRFAWHHDRLWVASRQRYLREPAPRRQRQFAGGRWLFQRDLVG